MSSFALGDMASHYRTLGQNRMLRTRMAVLNDELASGRVHDLARHLRGDQLRLGEIDGRIGRAGAWADAAKETGTMLGIMQSALGRIETARGALAGDILSLAAEPTEAQLASTAAAGAQALNETVVALNARFAGQALFSGVATDGAAIVSSETILAELRIAISTAGATTRVDVEATVEAWFAVGGGFWTDGYLGDTGDPLTRRVDEGRPLEIEPRADHPDIREILQGAALAALSADNPPALGRKDRLDMLHGAGNRLLGAALGLTELRGRLGRTEQRAEEALAAQQSEITALSMLRNDLVRADPNETAVALQEVQVQLDTHYTLISRLSRLTLSEYL